MNTIVIDTFYDFDFSGYRMPMICVFDSPQDQPGLFVARLFDLNQPTEYALLKTSLEALRECIPVERFHPLPRFEEDHPNVVEVWI